MSQRQNSRPNSKPKSKLGANSANKPQRQRPFNKNQKPPREKPAPKTSQPIQTPPPLPEVAPVDPDYVIIAQVAAPFGLRGAVKADIRTDFPERFERLTEAWLAPPDAAIDAPRTLRKVVSAKQQNEKQVVIRFEGASKPEHAEELRGYTVAVPRGEVVPLPEDEYYIFQLIGLDVYSEKDEYVGKVHNVLQYPANDVYEVRGPLSPDPVLIPAVKDIVKKIDLENQRITIELREGLI